MATAILHERLVHVIMRRCEPLLRMPTGEWRPWVAQTADTLSLARCTTPIAALGYLVGLATNLTVAGVALAIMLLLVATDAIDGPWARYVTHGQGTEHGANLDRYADELVIISLLLIAGAQVITHGSLQLAELVAGRIILSLSMALERRINLPRALPSPEAIKYAFGLDAAACLIIGGQPWLTPSLFFTSVSALLVGASAWEWAATHD